jgi:hypothetical protein
MPQLAIAAAGAWIGGSALGTGVVALGMTGTAIGWTAGSLLGSLLFAPKGPKAQIGDTRAPKIDHGSKMPRIYGTYRVPLNPRWLPEFTAESQSAGGKGGGGGSEYYTYTSSPLYWAADGTNVIGFSRIWKNGELVYTRLAASDANSLANSANTAEWQEVEFFDGNSAQLPWSVYEAAVGSVNADAHRNIACLGFTALACGNSPQLPFMEAEIYTNATLGDPIWRNHVTFGDDTAADTSYYDATPSITGTEGVDYTISGGVFESFNSAINVGISWSGAHLVPQNGVPITIQAKGAMSSGGEQQYTPSLYEYGSGTFTFVIGCNTSFGSGDLWRFNVRWPGNSGSFHGAFFEQGEHHHCELIVTPTIAGATVTSATVDVYVDGQLEHSDVCDSAAFDTGDGYCQIYSPVGTTTEGIEVEYAGTAFAALHSANFSPPADLPPADGPPVIPGPEDLADIVSAECLRSGLTAGEIDVTDLVGIEVAGFKCEGSAADAIGQLMGAFYFYCLPGRKLVFRLMDAASVATIQAADTGAGVDQASEVFAGLMRGNDLELPAQVSLTAPNPSADYDPATATSDRIITVGNRIEQATLAVVFTPAELKGRANANVLDARVAAHTATLSVDDTFAAYEPGDVITHVDEEGNSYITRWLKESYQQNVKTVDLRLFDRSVLTLTGTMSDTYTPALTVTAPAVPVLYLFDSPILRDADDGHGIYATVTANGDWEGAELFLSRDDVTYESVGTFANRGVVGTATELGDFTGWTWDTANSMTVTLDAGTDGLTASTKAAIEADATVNVALVGTHERWEAVRFANASLLGADTYLLSDFLRGQFGTEHANAEHEAGDTFVLMRTTGVIRVPLVSGDLGNTLYLKAVPPGVALSAVTATTIEYTAEGLKPYAPVDLHAEVESGATVVSWNRRSRYASSLFGVAPPLGEASESYDVELYDGVTLEVSETVTEPEWEVQALAESFTLGRSGQDIREVNGDLLTLREGTDLSNGAVDVLDASDGSVIDGEPLGEQTKQLADDGTVVFVATVNGSLASHLFRYDPASIGTPTHTYVGTLAADVQGAAFDGTDVWVSEFYSGQIRQLDASDLTVLNSYSITGAPGRMFFDGSLWVCMAGGLDVAEIDISDGSVLQRVPVGGVPLDVVVAGGFVFVQTGSAINVYSDSTGALVASEAVGSITTSRAAHLALFDGFAVGADPSTGELVFMSTTTGLFAKRMPLANLRGVSGSTASLLFATTFAGFHETVALADSALTGKTVTVYQNSAAVGRGYPAEVEL